MKLHNPITVYKHNKVADRYNGELHPSKYPYFVGGAAGSAIGGAIAYKYFTRGVRNTSAFRFTTQPSVYHYGGTFDKRIPGTIAGALGGATGGVLAARSAVNMKAKLRQHADTYGSRKVPRRAYITLKG